MTAKLISLVKAPVRELLVRLVVNSKESCASLLPIHLESRNAITTPGQFGVEAPFKHCLRP